MNFFTESKTAESKMTESKQEQVNKKTNEICAVCLETVERNKNKSRTVCGHCFHSTCLLKCVKKNIDNCPLCKKHLFKKEMTMRELYEKSKDTLFTFSTFCYIMNMVDNPEIQKSITDYNEYDDDNFNYSDDDEDEEDNEKDKLFSVKKFETQFVENVETYFEYKNTI
jgi:hypothetical protein